MLKRMEDESDSRERGWALSTKIKEQKERTGWERKVEVEKWKSWKIKNKDTLQYASEVLSTQASTTHSLDE